MPPVREKDILAACLRLLNLLGILAWRSNSGGLHAEHKGKRRYVRFSGALGLSDIIGVLPDGRFFACETKRPGGKLTTNQGAFLDAVNRVGGLGLCVTSPEELLAGLRSEGVVA